MSTLHLFVPPCQCFQCLYGTVYTQYFIALQRITKWPTTNVLRTRNSFTNYKRRTIATVVTLTVNHNYLQPFSSRTLESCLFLHDISVDIVIIYTNEKYFVRVLLCVMACWLLLFGHSVFLGQYTNRPMTTYRSVPSIRYICSQWYESRKCTSLAILSLNSYLDLMLNLSCDPLGLNMKYLITLSHQYNWGNLLSFSTSSIFHNFSTYIYLVVADKNAIFIVLYTANTWVHSSIYQQKCGWITPN